MNFKRYSTISFIFLWMSIVPSANFAASGKLSGVVKDATTGEPLIGANVMIEGAWSSGQVIKFDRSLGAASDVEGFYYILNVPPGRYAVKAMMMGYESKQITNVRVELNRTINLDFVLRPVVLAGETVSVTAEREIVRLDVSSSQLILDKSDTENLAVGDVQEIFNLTPGVAVDAYTGKINIRGGGSDQVMAYLDGFAMKDNVFNVPFLSFNRTSIEEISIITGGFLAEYGDLRSGIINVITTEGRDNYSVSFDGRYSPPGYKYSGPKRYTEDKNYLIYGSDISMDSVRLATIFPLPADDFIGWPKFAERALTDEDSTNDMSPNQRRELWRWRHRGREEGHLPDYIVDGTVSGPMPGRFMPLLGPMFSKMNFALSHRAKYDAYANPAYRDHFEEQNTTLKLTYHLSPAMRLKAMGMLANEKGMGDTRAEGGADGFVMRTGVGGFNNQTSYHNLGYPLGDVKTTNWGLSFVHTLSPKTFYEIRTSRMDRKYNIRPGPARDLTLIKHIPSEFYEIESDSLKAHGYWDSITEHYVAKDTTFYRGDELWFPDSSYNEAPDGWMGPGDKDLDQVGLINLRQSGREEDEDHSSGWSLNIRGDLTSQVNKYHQIKTGFQFNQNRINRDWYNFRGEGATGEYRATRFSESPRYGAGYFQDRIEIRGIIANLGVRYDIFDANSKDYGAGDPFIIPLFEENIYTNIDSIEYIATKKHHRISPRLGISHPMTASSKIFFNYGHAYNAPSNTYKYGFVTHPNIEGNLQWWGNPNLKPQKNVQYELGYEQVLLDGYLIHTSLYYKDVTDELSGIVYKNAFAPDPNARYNTWDNTAYQDIIGWEFRMYKQVGRFLTGWIQTEVRGQKSGIFGETYRYVEGDPLNKNQFAAFTYPQDVMWQWVPSVVANVDFHTPHQWGPELFGSKIFAGFRINAILSFAQGAKTTWNPRKSPFVRDNLKSANSFMSDFYISKAINIGGLGTILYCDVHNLFSRKLLNVGVLDGSDENMASELYKYYASLEEGGGRIGDYKESHIVAPKQKPGENYIYRVGGPVKIFFGLRFNFNTR